MDNTTIDYVIEQDTIIVDKNDKKDTIIIANDFIVLKEDSSLDFHIEKVEYWMKQPRGIRGKQGGDAYNGLFCQFEGGHSILDILDINNKQHITTLELEYNSDYHCNNADFSNTFYDLQDEFPLLYSSQQDRYARCIIVDRIVKRDGNYDLETVQKIYLPYDKEEPLQHYPDAVLDNENRFIYVYAGRSVEFCLYKFRLPKIEEGEVVQLREEDILSRWAIFDNPARYRQGSKMIGDFIITLEGRNDIKMRIIDLENHRDKLIDLKSDLGAKWEPEDIFVIDGEIFMASGATGIYKIELSDD